MEAIMPKGKGEAAVTDAELAGLSDEEREALEDEDTSDAGALKQLAGEDEGDGDDEDAGKAAAKDKDSGKAAEAEADEDEDEAEGAKGKDGKEAADKDAAGKDAGEKDAKDAKGAKDAGAAAEAGEGEEEEDDEPQPFFPRYTAPAVENYAQQIAALDKRQTDAETKFKAGDLELDALRAEDRKIEAERRALNEAKFKHDIAVDQNTQADAQSWQFEIDRFMHRVKVSDGVDYKNNRTFNAALDQAVKDLASMKDKDGKLVNEDKPGRWFLREAHKQVMKDIGREDAGVADDAGGDAKAKEAKVKAAAAARKADPKKLPKTLAKVPAADADDAGGDPEFSHLEGLGGLELEDQVARMTPAQQDRWARSSGAV